MPGKRKKAKQGGRKGGSKRQKTRGGYSSVARTRGGAVTGEMKYFDTVKAATNLAASNDWTGTEYDPTTYNTLCCPIVGAGVDQRIGKMIKIMKIKVRGFFIASGQANVTTADNATQIRLLLVQDKQTNSTQAQGEDVMTSGGSASLNVNTFQNINNFGRFRVLKDKTYTLQNPNMSYDGTNLEQAGLMKTWKFTINFKNPPVVRFNATNGGTVADIVDNSFHIMANISNADLVPQISYVCRVCYKE